MPGCAGCPPAGAGVAACGCNLNFCPHCGIPACRPARPLTHYPGALDSTYRVNYQPKPILREGPCGLSAKEKTLVPSPGRFQGETTTKADFTPKSGGARSSFKVQQGPVPHRPFDPTTTYSAFHNGKQGSGHAPRARAPAVESAPFAGISSHKVDYLAWAAQPSAPCKEHPPMVELPFLGASTYKQDFTPKQMPEWSRHAPAAMLPSNNRLNCSTYGKDFVPLPLEESVRPRCCDDVRHALVHSHELAETQHGLRSTGGGAAAQRFMGTQTGGLFSLNR